MNQFIKTSLLSMGLAIGAGVTGSYGAGDPAENKEPVAEVKADTQKDAKATSSSNKQEVREKRKAERSKKLLETCEKDIKELETKVADAKDVAKKQGTLSLAHAKLEAEAAKDADLAQSAPFHGRRCKQYISRGNDALAGKFLKAQETRAEKKN